MDRDDVARIADCVSARANKFEAAAQIVRLFCELEPDHLAGISYLSFDDHSGWAVLHHRIDREHARVIVLAIARLLRSSGSKEPQSDGEGLSVTFVLSNGYHVVVRNYVPPECQLITKQRLVPAVPEHVETYQEISCSGPNDVL